MGRNKTVAVAGVGKSLSAPKKQSSTIFRYYVDFAEGHLLWAVLFNKMTVPFYTVSISSSRGLVISRAPLRFCSGHAVRLQRFGGLA